MLLNSVSPESLARVARLYRTNKEAGAALGGNASAHWLDRAIIAAFHRQGRAETLPADSLPEEWPDPAALIVRLCRASTEPC